jgi:hypothetical protein
MKVAGRCQPQNSPGDRPTSFVSVNGPSSTGNFPKESRTRELVAIGASSNNFTFFSRLRA